MFDDNMLENTMTLQLTNLIHYVTTTYGIWPVLVIVD
jgi:hypothetical protein